MTTTALDPIAARQAKAKAKEDLRIYRAFQQTRSARATARRCECTARHVRDVMTRFRAITGESRVPGRNVAHDRVTLDERRAIVQSCRSGLSFKDIAEEQDLPEALVRRIILDYIRDPSASGLD